MLDMFHVKTLLQNRVILFFLTPHYGNVYLEIISKWRLSLTCEVYHKCFTILTSKFIREKSKENFHCHQQPDFLEICVIKEICLESLIPPSVYCNCSLDWCYMGKFYPDRCHQDTFGKRSKIGKIQLNLNCILI